MGFFGGGNATENVKVSELETYLNKLFDAKIKALDGKASSLLNKVEYTKSMFIDACDRLYALDKEPNIEYGFAGRANYFKSLKNSYARALKNVVTSAQKPSGHATAYERHSAALVSLNVMVKAALETNMEFKHVLAAYGNDMTTLKKHFAAIEQARGELETELDAKRSDYKEYEALLGVIREVLYINEDIAGLDGEMLAVREMKPGEPVGQERRTVADMKLVLQERLDRKVELSNQLTNLVSEIETSVKPLDRVAKKFDYTSGGMTKIGALVEDPVSTLVNGNVDYNGFAKSVEALGEKVQSNEIEAKGKERVMKSVYDIVSGKIYKSILAAKELISEVAVIDSELERMEREVRETESAARSKEEVASKAERVKKLRDELLATRGSKTVAVQDMFSKCYRKNVKVIYPA